VVRALEKLRALFAKRGVTLPAAVIAAAVTANSVQAAPAGLAMKISMLTAKGAGATTSITTLMKGTLKIMTYAKIKVAAGLAAGILLAGGTAVVVLAQTTFVPRTAGESIDAKIARLNKKGTTAKEVIQVLGEPLEYASGTNTFTKNKLPRSYQMAFSGGIEVSINGGLVSFLRSVRPGPGFNFHNLHLGSSLDEVMKEAGPPSDVVTGGTLAWLSDPTQPDTSIPGVLYKDLNGLKGFGYYRRPDKHLQFFLKDDAVIALLVDVP
jgi:hypothetical protein